MSDNGVFPGVSSNRRSKTARIIPIALSIGLSLLQIAVADDDNVTSRQVTGRATFVDGTPIVDSLIRFYISPHDSKTVHGFDDEIDCTTDADGKYEFTLPTRKPYKALVLACENGEAGGGRKWQLNLSNLSSEGEPLNLVFENRGRILVGITYKAELPGDFQPEIMCMSRSYGPRTTITEKPRATRRGISFTNLTPGEYELTVAIKGVNRRWTYPVTVPDREPRSVSANVIIPMFFFGGIKAKFLMPDGETPAAGVGFYLVNTGEGRELTADENGEILLERVLEGRFGLTPSAPKGVDIAVASVFGPEVENKVIGGEVKDLGVIRLKRIDEVFGHVDVAVRNDDCTPVDPVHVEGAEWQQIGSPYEVPSEDLDKPGLFRIRLRPGKHNLSFLLREKPNPSAMQVDWGDERDDRARLFADVDAEVGKTLPRELILRRRKKDDQITVTHNESASRWYSVRAIVVLDGFQWQFTGHRKLTAEPPVVITNIPAGDCHIAFSTLGTFIVKTIPETSRRSAVHFDVAQTGRINVAAVDSEGRPLPKPALRVSRLVGGTEVLVCHVPPVGSPANDDYRRVALARYYTMFTENSDGTMTISGLGAGTYKLALSNDDWTHEQYVEVRSENVTTWNVQIGPDGAMLQESLDHG